ncbi:MAG: lysoplasmalogenase [Bradymonadia bacterium]
MTFQFQFYLFCSALTSAAVLGLLGSEWRDSQAGRWLFKPIAALGFVLAGVAMTLWHTTHGQWIFAGLLLSVLGDLFLIPRAAGRFFKLGLFSFLLAHVAYAIACFYMGLDAWHAVFALGILGLVAWYVYSYFAPDLPPSLVMPVRIYISVITLMVALSLATGSLLMSTAAFAFWLSDISVARGRFKKTGFGNKLWGIPLYFGAQLMFAFAGA